MEMVKEQNISKLKRRVLVVDDDPVVVERLRDLFESNGIEVTGARTAKEAFYAIRSYEEVFPVIILDFILPDMSGDELTKNVKALSPTSYIYTLSGAPSELENAVNSIKNGADNFFQKADNLDYLEEAVLAAFKEWEGSSSTYIDQQIEKEISANGLATRSEKMKLVITKAIQGSRNKVNILITGETGTGKELIAKLIANKFGGPFYPVNCSKFVGDAELLESELFGHEKGAFTGAISEKKGIFEEASGGVVYLDEIDRMSLSSQAKLLRAIQEKKIKRIGGNKEIDVNIKIVASSKPTIKDQRDSGEFLADLYGRLNVIRLDLPPLRDRTEDIDILIGHFAKKHLEDIGEIKSFHPSAIELLKSYHWPENIRELENFYLRVGIHVTSNTIRSRDLLEHIDAFSDIKIKKSEDFHFLSGVDEDLSYKEIKENFDKFLLKAALKKNQNSISATARHLRMNKATLHHKLRNLDILPNK